MRGVRGVRVGALLVALGLMVAACGGGDDEGDTGTGGDTAEAKKVGLVYDIGGRGDQSFNDSAGAGIDAAKQEQGDKIEVKEIEPNADGSNRKELLDSLAEEGYGLNIGVGFLFSEDIAKSASEAPDTTFAVVDGFADSCTQPDSNLLCLGFKEEEGSFLVGAAAALKTESDTVGFVGGLEGDLIKKFQAGYEAGVKYIADQEGKDIEVLVDYAGNTPEAFRNPAKGKELALKQIGQGADVIYHASGGTGAGVISAAAAEQKYVIGVDSDQSLTASEAERKWILTSMLKRVDTAVQQTIGAYVDGTLKGGIQTFGLDHVEQGQGGEGLGEVVVGPGGQALVAVAFLGLGGEHDDHDVAGVGVGLELAADLEAVQPGHHDVEQDQPGALAPGHLEGLDPVGRLQDLVLVALQGDVHQGPHGRFVVGDQQLHRPLPASSSEVGRVKRNTEPTPGQDSAHSRPPCISTSRLVMYRPRPVPPARRTSSRSTR